MAIRSLQRFNSTGPSAGNATRDVTITAVVLAQAILIADQTKQVTTMDTNEAYSSRLFNATTIRFERTGTTGGAESSATQVIEEYA